MYLLLVLLMTGCASILDRPDDVQGWKEWGMKHCDGDIYPVPPEGHKDFSLWMTTPEIIQARCGKNAAACTLMYGPDGGPECYENRRIATIMVPWDAPWMSMCHEMAHVDCVLTSDHEIRTWW